MPTTARFRVWARNDVDRDMAGSQIVYPQNTTQSTNDVILNLIQNPSKAVTLFTNRTHSPPNMLLPGNTKTIKASNNEIPGLGPE
ncbi:MAG TPA: hypothetical protein VKA34_07700 [Balneolales bacterium]|nr:hypothetical protein [Balneolales bacterium]